MIVTEVNSVYSEVLGLGVIVEVNQKFTTGMGLDVQWGSGSVSVAKDYTYFGVAEVNTVYTLAGTVLYML